MPNFEHPFLLQYVEISGQRDRDESEGFIQMNVLYFLPSALPKQYLAITPRLPASTWRTRYLVLEAEGGISLSRDWEYLLCAWPTPQCLPGQCLQAGLGYVSSYLKGYSVPFPCFSREIGLWSS